MRLGLIVILVGVLFFFKNLGLINNISWNILWPIVVMLIGISMVLRRRCGCGGWGCKWCKWCRGSSHLDHDMEGIKNICSCDCNSCKDCVTPDKHKKM